VYGPVGLPAHIQITFGLPVRTYVQPGDPVLTIVPVAAYGQLWEQSGNPSATAELERLRNLLAARPAEIAGVPTLPFEQATGVDDLGVQARYQDFAWGSGVRLVGRMVADPEPVTREGLFYMFQGYSADGQFLVSLFYPVTTDALPTGEALSADERRRAEEEPATYLAERIAQLDALAASDWSPDLGRLDALLGSLEY
jgi:hypothetical protein